MKYAAKMFHNIVTINQDPTR
uniref:Uncharacterized protein n=1 Tax=Anguilla anguilla TaxID=7936 RepID=A0A0E9U8G2_ANGAN